MRASASIGVVEALEEPKVRGDAVGKLDEELLVLPCAFGPRAHLGVDNEVAPRPVLHLHLLGLAQVDKALGSQVDRDHDEVVTQLGRGQHHAAL